MVAVPSDYMRIVVFLTVEERGDDNLLRRIPKATGFILRVPIEGISGAAVDYVVTARHCIEEARPYGNIYIRLNRSSAAFFEIPTNAEDWFTHDSADVALILLPQSHPKDFNQVRLTLDTFVGPGPHYKYRGSAPEIGPVEIQPTVGHEIYFIGLFTQHYGQEQNLPIARFGRISRMPSELEVESGDIRFKTVAYLAEFQSWGGHSGSPVFFLYPVVLEERRNQDVTFNTAHISGLLGIISGHFDIPKQAKTQGDLLGGVQVDLNSGIAIVTPAEAIRELLLREDVTGQRKETVDK